MPAKPLTQEQLDDAARLRAIFDRVKESDPSVTQEYVADSCGWKTQGTVSQYMNGKIPLNLRALFKFCDVFGVQPEEISPSLARQQMIAPITKAIVQIARSPKIDSHLDIPHLSARGSMGVGELKQEEEEVIDRITLKAEWIKSNLPGCRVADLAVISGRGNSMAPTFNDGDLLLVDTAIKEVNIDGVYVLSAHNRLFIKTVRQRIDGSFEISSDNQSVKTVDVLNGDHQVTVHGRVVWSWNGKRL